MNAVYNHVIRHKLIVVSGGYSWQWLARQANMNFLYALVPLFEFKSSSKPTGKLFQFLKCMCGVSISLLSIKPRVTLLLHLSFFSPFFLEGFGCCLLLTYISNCAEFVPYRVIFLVTGLLLMASASSMSKSILFYYSSAMTVGVLLIVLMILFQVTLKISWSGVWTI